jgi:hypothetical protein
MPSKQKAGYEPAHQPLTTVNAVKSHIQSTTHRVDVYSKTKKLINQSLIMTSLEIWLALASFFIASFSGIIYFRNSGTKLEKRANDIIRQKRPLISQSYLEVAEKICERFKTKRLLTNELEERLEDVSFAKVWLNFSFVEQLKHTVNRLTRSFAYGFFLVVSIIGFAYLPIAGFDPTITFWLQLFFVIGISIFGYRYISDGIFSISALRKLEILFNEIERTERFKELFRVLEDGFD